MVKIADHSAVIFGTHFPNRIFVGCLPPKAVAQDLAEFFSHFGTVNEAKIVLDENGNSKRFGFVSFVDERDVEGVLQHGSIFFWGKKINVGPAIKKMFSDDVKGLPATVVLDESARKTDGKSRVVYQSINKCAFQAKQPAELAERANLCHAPVPVYPSNMFPLQIDAMHQNVYPLPMFGFQPPYASAVPVTLTDPSFQLLSCLPSFPPQHCNISPPGYLKSSVVSAGGTQNQQTVLTKGCH